MRGSIDFRIQVVTFCWPGFGINSLYIGGLSHELDNEGNIWERGKC